MTTGHELIKMLQGMGDAALNLPVKVLYHQTYDSEATLEDANTVSIHIPDPWHGKRESYLSIRHADNGGTGMWDQ